MSRVSLPLPSSEPRRSKQTTGPCIASIETSSSRSRQPCGAMLRPTTQRVHPTWIIRQPRVEFGSRYNKRTPAMQPRVGIHNMQTHPRQPSLCLEPKTRQLQCLTGPQAPLRKQTVHLLCCQDILQRSSWAAPCPPYPQTGLMKIYRSCAGGASIPHCWASSSRYASRRAHHETHPCLTARPGISSISLCVEHLSSPRLPVPNPVVHVLM